MDPSIVKLFEEDEDESMHSGADVDALQAALNRHIVGDTPPSQPSETGVLPQGSQTGFENTLKQDWHSSEMDQKHHGSVSESQQQQLNEVSKEFSHLPLQQKQIQDDHQESVTEKMTTQVPQTTGMHKSEKSSIPVGEPERINNQDGDSQYLKLQKISNQQTSSTQQPSIPMNRCKQVPFAMLLPALLPQLDPDRAMQLRTLYGKLKKNEIAKEGFVRHMRDIVGDKVLKFAVQNLNVQLNSQPSSRQTQFTGSQTFSQLQQKGTSSPADPSHASGSAVPMETDSSYPSSESNSQKLRDLEYQSDSCGVIASQVSGSANQDKERSSITQGPQQSQQQQRLHFPQTTVPMYGSNNYRPYSGPKVNTPGPSVKLQPQDSQLRQITHNQNMGSTPAGGSTQAMNTLTGSKFERPNSMIDPSRLQSGSLSRFTSNSTVQQNPVPRQLATSKEHNSGLSSSMSFVKHESVDQGTEQQPKLHFSTPHGLSAAQLEQGNAIPIALKDEPGERQSSRVAPLSPASVLTHNSVSPSQPMALDPNVSLSSRVSSVTSPAGVNSRTPPKKPSIGQKKPLEGLGSPPMASKKQKVSGTFSDQSIEQLNDVTAVSGVNLREEEEQLFSGPAEDSRVSEASRRVVQEEEERLILHRTSLQKKLAEIMVKCGLKSISNDVERCLSLCVEERLRGLVCNLIRLSKQRVDAEKPRHQTLITSDVRQQIETINKKDREEFERKQAEVEKLRKVNEPEGDSLGDGDKEKDEVRVKSLKANKEEDDKMRTTAANVAARAAVGGDDMLSKWQLMAEQARQKREGVMDTASDSQAGKDMSRKPTLTSGKKIKDNQEAERRGHLGAARKFGRSQGAMPQTRVSRTISIKDVIGVLEREPQMSKSTLLYRLYERIQSAPAE
ncbi:hypothetical protein SLA2020_461860 [Shorea laevis]